MTAQLPLAPDADPSALHAWLVATHGLTPVEASAELYGTYCAPEPAVVDLNRYDTEETS